MDDVYIGFDSAWTDSPKSPGAFCAVSITGDRPVWLSQPEQASFCKALEFIRDIRSRNKYTLIALDQPTVVPNSTGMRPVERVAASLISWIGGGVQPAHRGKLGMFCDASPIWRFLTELNAVEDPERARIASEGLYLMEVFPALALASLEEQSFNRMAAPKYNPSNNKFRADDWIRVAKAAAQESEVLGSDDLASWCHTIARIEKVEKKDQDMLDAVLCVLTALRWRLRPREESLLLGDLNTGYMVFPASAPVRERLIAAARKLWRTRKLSVRIDGKSPL